MQNGLQNNSPIAIFDSGVGGLSIYQEVKKLMPHEQIVYLADQKHCPYGDKSASAVRSLTLRCLKFLLHPVRCRRLSHGTKLIIIACNTATVLGIDVYRKKFPGIPIIGVVPVVKTAAEKTKNHRIAILSTLATAKSKYQKNLISKFCPKYKVLNFSFPASPDFSDFSSLHSHLVLNIGCPNLVHHVEHGITQGPQIESEFRQILHPVISAHCDILVLGCTHYPFLIKAIEKVADSLSPQPTPSKPSKPSSSILNSKFLILNSGAAVARHAKHILEENHALNQSGFFSEEFFTTGNTQKFQSTLQKLIGLKTEVKKIEV